MSKIVPSAVMGSPELDPISSLGTPNTAFEFKTSSLTGLTALSPTPDIENADTTIPGHYYLQDNASGNAAVGRYATAPSAPWTAICKLSDHRVKENFNLAGMFFGEATPGRMISHGPAYNYSQMDALDWDSPTDGTPASLVAISPLPLAPLWLAVRADSSTDFNAYFSRNGQVWVPHFENHNPGFTVASVGLFMAAINANGCAAAFEFLRIWNFALTLPGVA